MTLHRLLLAQHRLHARQIAAQRLELAGCLELSHRLLDAQPEQLIVEILLALLQFVDRQIAELPYLHDAFSSAKRVANLVLIGSFAAARRMASRASVSLTPSISKRMRPGRTTQTHCSGAPLPLPMRVSCGFLVIGLSGNTRIQILPPRLMKRVIATRAASICRSVIQHGSSAFSPSFPNELSPPRHALPGIRPRCCLRYFTFLGINITTNPCRLPLPASRSPLPAPGRCSLQWHVGSRKRSPSRSGSGTARRPVVFLATNSRSKPFTLVQPHLDADRAV